MILPAKNLIVSKEAQTEPSLLVKELTANLTSETEKFNALFSWVAHNIRYNYRAYFSPGGTYSNIQTILRRRSAICLGYAELMDTLCYLAGIPNVSVYGYAKDEFFDVKDSLYIDNHAWNAVKLDGLWYVYDVTWSTGVPQYKLNRFNKWKLKQQTKATKKYKQKNNKRKFSFIDYCGKEHKNPAFYYKQKIANKLFIWFMRHFHVKYQRTFSRAVNSYYYLTQPEVFAITHFPDDPTWALLDQTTIRKFENDSAFYYLHDSVYKQQVRAGKECSACDDFYNSNKYQRTLVLKNQSLVCNPKNNFIQSLCNYNLGEHYFKLTDNEADSLTSLKYIDSAAYFFTLSSNYLKSTKTGIVKEFKLLTKKNITKLNLLLNENKANRSFVTNKVRVTLEQKRNFYIISRRTDALLRTYDRKTGSLKRIRVSKPKKLPLNNSKTISIITTKLAEKTAIIDSLKLEKDSLKNIFNKEIDDLSLNIWIRVLYHDTLFKPLIKSIRLRSKLKDNYKKVIIDQRNQLSFINQFYTSSLKSSVYDPAIRSSKNFKLIIKLIDLKYAYERDCIRLQQSLVKQGALSVSEFNAYKKELVNKRKEDYCWLTNYEPHFNSIANGLGSLRNLQSDLFDLLNAENHIERLRYRYLNLEYLRRDHKHKNIVDHNKHLLKAMLKANAKKRRRITAKRKK